MIGNKKKRKQEKNSNDSRESITCLRIGSAAGDEGPRVFLTEGKSLGHHRSFNIHNFATTYRAPPGSHVIPTPSVYMTDDTWIELAEPLAKGIRAMSVIKDHPDWWCLLSLDGYGSHLKTDALAMFAKYNILVIKEEGDSSHLCQAYDQLVAKQDKRVTRNLLEGYRYSKHGVITQYELVIIANTAMNAPNSADAWRTSHIRVNMCPSQMIPFTDWLKKHEASVSAADRFFESRISLFDAMPAMWKNLSEIQRREISELVDSMETIVVIDPNTGPLWSIDNVRSVMRLGYIAYDDMHKLRACLVVAKEDPTVFLNPVASVVAASSLVQTSLDDHSFKRDHTKLKEVYMKEKADCGWIEHGYQGNFVAQHGHEGPQPNGTFLSPAGRDAASSLYLHITNFVARHHGWHIGGDLVPSTKLQVDFTKDQRKLLNPTPRDIQMGAIMDQCGGHMAVKKIAKRRICFISNNVNSYARILNGPQQLQQIGEFNELAANIAALRLEKEELELNVREEKRLLDIAKAERKAEKERKMQIERDEKGPGCKADVEKGLEHVLSLNNTRRREILRIHYGIIAGVYKMSAPETMAEFRKLMIVDVSIET